MLFLQTVKPSKIILMNTQDSKEDTKELVEWLSLETKNPFYYSTNPIFKSNLLSVPPSPLIT